MRPFVVYSWTFFKIFFCFAAKTPDTQQNTLDWVSNSIATQRPQSPQYDKPENPLDDDEFWDSPAGAEPESPEAVTQNEDDDEDEDDIISYEPTVPPPNEKKFY